MSKETLADLNRNTLIGMTDKRGNAWHYRSDLQADEPNHYPGAIPVDDVLRRLFNFTVEPRPVYICTAGEFTEVAGRAAWVTDDTNETLGIFADSYAGHQYSDWLLDNVAAILDDDLIIGSAGLLRGRRKAWVSVEAPDNLTTPEGVEFRPHLLAATSFDGTLATTYKRCVTNVVCDNTLFAGLNETGQTLRLRHSKHSQMRIQEARSALEVVFSTADDFAAEVKRLCDTAVSDKQWENFLTLAAPVPDGDGRGRTVATTKRETLNAMYLADPRCAPWHGTMYGAYQTMNTYNNHVAPVRGIDPGARFLRAQESAMVGKTAADDMTVIKQLETVCA